MNKRIILKLLIITLVESMFIAITPLETLAAKPRIVYSQGTASFAAPTPTPITMPKLSGYISPDFAYSESAKSELNSGFTVEIGATSQSVKTDSSGYFEIANIPPIDALTYIVRISKPGYLTRFIRNVTIKGDTKLSSQDSPVLIWAGNFTQDTAINMSDLMEVAKAFNSMTGDGRYISDYDINKDKAVNMSDIIAVAKHFNAITSSYPA